MRIGLWRTSMYKDDGVYRGITGLGRALIELGHDVVDVGRAKPDITPLMDCDVVMVYEAMWNWGKKTDPATVLNGVRAIGPEKCIVGVNCPLDSLKGPVREPTLQLLREVPRVWTNSRHRVAGVRDDAFVIPYILHWRRYDHVAAGSDGLIATGRLWDKRKRIMLPVEAGYRGDYTLCGAYGLWGGWIRSQLLLAGAVMLTEDPSNGGRPWTVGWTEPGGGEVEYVSKYRDYTEVPWERARVHFAGVEAGWVGDPGLLETVTLEAMDAGLNVVVPAHCNRDAMDYTSVFSFEGDDPTEAIQGAMEDRLHDHTHDLALHDPVLFARRLLLWSWTP
jgi:hypothetical protein